MRRQRSVASAPCDRGSVAGSVSTHIVLVVTQHKLLDAELKAQRQVADLEAQALERRKALIQLELQAEKARIAAEDSQSDLFFFSTECH